MPTDSPHDVARFLTIADAAELLDLDASAVLTLVSSGELAAIRLGNSSRWRIERGALDAYIDALYEESRRQSLWLQSDFGSIPELSAGSILRSPDS